MNFWEIRKIAHNFALLKIRLYKSSTLFNGLYTISFNKNVQLNFRDDILLSRDDIL